MPDTPTASRGVDHKRRLLVTCVGQRLLQGWSDGPVLSDQLNHARLIDSPAGRYQIAS